VCLAHYRRGVYWNKSLSSHQEIPISRITAAKAVHNCSPGV